MFQLRALNDESLTRVERECTPFTEGESLDTLEARADEWVRALRETRRDLAKSRGGLDRLHEGVDRRLRTETIELLDRPEVSDERKWQIVRTLDRLNRTIFSYHRFFAAMVPLLRRAHARTGRPARVLELAAGAGEFTLRASTIAKWFRVPVEVTGSDIVESYIDRGRAEANRRGVQANFERINAFDMSDIPTDSYDVAFIGQSMHHFTPGQLARMIRGCERVCSDGLVGVDGQRSMLLLSTVPVYGMMVLDPYFAHDALLSTRKFYSEPELSLIARLAAPDSLIGVRSAHPGYSVLTVDFAR